MSTKPSTIDYLLDQLASLDRIAARKMFGEYALYCDQKVVALVCDDKLYVKITEAGKAFNADSYQEGFAYPGAKASMFIDDDQIEDADWLCELIQITADSLPLPKVKKSASFNRS